MGEFWIQVGKSAIEFVFLAAVAFGAVVLGMKLRMSKDAKQGK